MSKLKTKTPYVGEVIAEVRRQKRLTQEALADLLSIEYSRLGKWERGVHKFPVDLLPQVAQVLGEDITFTATGEIKIGKGSVTMTTLLEVLQLNDVKQALLNQVLGDEQAHLQVLEAAKQGTCDKQSNSTLLMTLELDGELKSFENHLYTNEDHSFYLLESRLFDVDTDEMEGVYLNVFYPDFTEYEPYIEDVWDFDCWELVE